VKLDTFGSPVKDSANLHFLHSARLQPRARRVGACPRMRRRSGGSGLMAAGSRMSTQQAVNYAAADGAGLLAGK
jgi:hypothetical protein